MSFSSSPCTFEVGEVLPEIFAAIYKILPLLLYKQSLTRYIPRNSNRVLNKVKTRIQGASSKRKRLASLKQCEC